MCELQMHTLDTSEILGFFTSQEENAEQILNGGSVMKSVVFTTIT